MTRGRARCAPLKMFSGFLLVAGDATGAGAPQSKKSYLAPGLIRWGDLQEITRSAGKSSSTPDGGAKWQSKQTS